VLDDSGQTIARLTARDAAKLIRLGVANKGMVAKLQACTAAVKRGVGDVLIANGRSVRFEMLATGRNAQAGTTPVVMYSALGDEATRSRALAAGADDYIVKTTPFADIKKRIAGLAA